MINVLIEKIQPLANMHWQQLEKPGDSALVWQSSISDPLPLFWPMREQQLVFYLLAHAIDLRQPTGGETIANIWAKIITRGDAVMEFTVSHNTLIPSERQGLRPLTQTELQTLRIDPAALLIAPESPTAAAQLKSYYQLQLTLGNIPLEAITNHRDFFNWVNE